MCYLHQGLWKCCAAAIFKFPICLIEKNDFRWITIKLFSILYGKCVLQIFNKLLKHAGRVSCTRPNTHALFSNKKIFVVMILTEMQLTVRLQTVKTVKTKLKNIIAAPWLTLFAVMFGIYITFKTQISCGNMPWHVSFPLCHHLFCLLGFFIVHFICKIVQKKLWSVLPLLNCRLLNLFQCSCTVLHWNAIFLILCAYEQIISHAKWYWP